MSSVSKLSRAERYSEIKTLKCSVQEPSLRALGIENAYLQAFTARDILDAVSSRFDSRTIYLMSDLFGVEDYSTALPEIYEMFERVNNTQTRLEMIKLCVILLERKKEGRVLAQLPQSLVDKIVEMLEETHIVIKEPDDLLSVQESFFFAVVYDYVKLVGSSRKDALLSRLFRLENLPVSARLLALKPISKKHRDEAIPLLREAFENFADDVPRGNIPDAITIVGKERICELMPFVKPYLHDERPYIASLAAKTAAQCSSSN